MEIMSNKAMRNAFAVPVDNVDVERIYFFNVNSMFGRKKRVIRKTPEAILIFTIICKKLAANFTII